MKMSEEIITTQWIDPDDAPALDRDWFDTAELRKGDKVLRAGRPKSDNPKQAVSIRLDPEVIAFFREGGPGWQTRINDALKNVMAGQ
jgi:uncharacterized protein (DUF4415 family)